MFTFLRVGLIFGPQRWFTASGPVGSDERSVDGEEGLQMPPKCNMSLELMLQENVLKCAEAANLFFQKRQKGRGVFQQRANVESALDFLKKKSVSSLTFNFTNRLQHNNSVKWLRLLAEHMCRGVSRLFFFRGPGSGRTVERWHNKIVISFKCTAVLKNNKQWAKIFIIIYPNKSGGRLYEILLLRTFNSKHLFMSICKMLILKECKRMKHVDLF